MYMYHQCVTVLHVPNQVHELPQNHYGDNQKGTLFS